MIYGGSQLSLNELTINFFMLPEPSGMDLTKVGNILTVAVGLVPWPRPSAISRRKRFMMSLRVSSESRME